VQRRVLQTRFPTKVGNAYARGHSAKIAACGSPTNMADGDLSAGTESVEGGLRRRWVGRERSRASLLRSPYVLCRQGVGQPKSCGARDGPSGCRSSHGTLTGVNETAGLRAAQSRRRRAPCSVRNADSGQRGGSRPRLGGQLPLISQK
jgi:hypothetical protein